LLTFFCNALFFFKFILNHIIEIVASYSDDDIYLFDTSQEADKDAKYRYKGHRNSETSNITKKIK